MAKPENLSQPRKQVSPEQASPKQVSIERGGLGQSGYTAGRKKGDAALDDVVDTRNVAPPGSGSDGLGLDDRFTGRGGPVSDVERDGSGEAAAQPYSSANGAPGTASTEPDGASGRRDDDDDGDEPIDRSDRTDHAGERTDGTGD